MRVHAREYVGVYECVCVGVCMHASVRERVNVQHIAENFHGCKIFMSFMVQIKAIHIKFSPTKSLATHGHTRIWEAQPRKYSF